MSNTSTRKLRALHIADNDIAVRTDHYSDEHLQEFLQGEQLEVVVSPYSRLCWVHDKKGWVNEKPRNEFATHLMRSSLMPGTYFAGDVLVFGPRDAQGNLTGMIRNDLARLIRQWEIYTGKGYTRNDY